VAPETSNLHISFDRDPSVLPVNNAPHVLVIGAGIIGMSTAWTLLDSGFNVTVISKQYADRDGSRLTSQIAGALYAFVSLQTGLTNVDSTAAGSSLPPCAATQQT
jgi:D-amino-acid oxidase